MVFTHTLLKIRHRSSLRALLASGSHLQVCSTHQSRERAHPNQGLMYRLPVTAPRTRTSFNGCLVISRARAGTGTQHSLRPSPSPIHSLRSFPRSSHLPRLFPPASYSLNLPTPLFPIHSFPFPFPFPCLAIPFRQAHAPPEPDKNYRQRKPWAAQDFVRTPKLPVNPNWPRPGRLEGRSMSQRPFGKVPSLSSRLLTQASV